MTALLLGAEDAPAKLNLALHVRARMPDGYHALETLFAFTAFGDRIEALFSNDWDLTTAGSFGDAAGPMPDNLVLRAAQAFVRASGVVQPYHLRLHKNIPVAAGLGGGSADAAATLRLLNRLAGHPLQTETLLELAGELGADVPACINSHTARGEGRGDLLSPGPDLRGIPVLLANPRVAVPTGPVFSGWDGADKGPLKADWRRARNDLAAPAITLQPVIADVLRWLESLPGATFVRMSGSGATCFALFEDGQTPDVQPPGGWWHAATQLI